MRCTHTGCRGPREGWGLGWFGLPWSCSWFVFMCFLILSKSDELKSHWMHFASHTKERMKRPWLLSVRVIGSGASLASCDVASFSWHNSIISTYLHINKLGTKQNWTHASALRRVQKGLRKEIKGTPHALHSDVEVCFCKSMKVQFTVTI